MQKFLVALIGLSICSVNSASSQCEDGRYHDIIFSSAEVEMDILYGNNTDYQGADQDLYLDVYQAENDSEEFRPLIIFAHGGSFVGGSKDGPDVVPLCNDFARMGYVTASIQYRLGVTVSFFLEQPATEAVVRGFHDMKAAIRFFRKSVDEGNPYGIDPDQIYLAGVSAGGFITLHNAYMDDESEIPGIVDQTSAGLTGGIEGDSGNEGYSSEINAIVNICGALQDTTYMDADDVPVLSFHGPDDTVVPYGSDIQTLLGFPIVEVDGSESVHIKADELGLSNCFEIYEGQGHVPHVTNEAYYDTTRAIMSNFLSHLVCPDFDLNCEYTEISIVNVENEVKNESFLIYPNPASKELFLILPEVSDYSSVRIYNQLGMLVFETDLNPFTKKHEMDVAQFETGAYFIEWTNGITKKTDRLIISN